MVKRGDSLQFTLSLDLNLNVPQATSPHSQRHVFNFLDVLETLINFRVLNDDLTTILRDALQTAYVAHVGRDVGHWQAEAVALVFKL